jgi:uncharacterized protein YfaS (alpha-2-macroglobulin family)
MRQLFTPARILVGVALIVLVVLGVLFGPLVLRGPRVTALDPKDGEQGANPRAPILIVFDQWVSPEAVAAAVRLDPPRPFTVQLEGQRAPWRTAVKIVPEGGLVYDTHYRLTVGESLGNLFGRRIAQPVAVSFATLPYVSVASFDPSKDSREVALRAPITVEFSAPVLTEAEVQAAAEDPRLADRLPVPLALDPPAKGVGRWLSPTLFGFYLQENLRPATDYTATLAADLTGDGRGRMRQPLSWGFHTAAPLLAEARPFPDATDVRPDTPITVRLEPGVDTASAGEHFSLIDIASGTPVPGTVKPIEAGFQFVPAAALDRSVRYEVRLGSGVTSSYGATLNSQPIAWTFTTMGDLEVAQVEPPVNAQDVLTTTRRISVRFNHPVVALSANPASQAAPLEITPAVPGVGRWIDTSTYVFSPTAGLDPSTTYQMRVAGSLTDQTGGALRNDYRWSFSTIRPHVLDSLPEPDARYAAPDQPVRIVFNQPMDLDSLRASLSLRRSDGAAVSGTLTGAPGALPDDPDQYDDEPATGFVATFRPDAPLERGASYELTVAQSASAAQGRGSMAKGYRQSFRVAPLPALGNTTPTDGEQAAQNGGSLQLNFSTPMDWASVSSNLTITPKPTEIYTYSSDVQLFVGFGAKPETDYTVTIGAGARDRFGTPLGQEATIRYRTAPLAPSLSLVAQARVGTYSAYTSARFPVRYVNLDSVDYTLWRVPLTLAPELVGDYDAWNSYTPRASEQIKQERVALRSARNQEQIGLINAGKLEPGLYLLRVGANNVTSAGQTVDRQLIVVSAYTLTIKRSPQKMFVWAVDLASGQPAKDINLALATFEYGSNDKPGAQTSEPRELGRTDADGVLRVDLPDLETSQSLFLWSSEGEFAFGTTAWSDGISPWDFGLQADYDNSPLVGSISTDRPIYRPEQSVYIRGALRRIQGERYGLPEQQRVLLAISDSNGTDVLSVTLPLSPFGTFSTSMPLERSARLGTYSMRAVLQDRDQPEIVTGSFTVAEYRKPTFEITVVPTPTEVLQGDSLTFTVSARYFSGGALANAPVRWRVLGKPYYFQPESAGNFRFEDLEDAYAWYRWFDNTPNDGGERVADGEGRTDSAGNLTIRLPATLGKDNHSRTLTLDVDVTDIDGNVISAQGSATAHAGAFYIGLRPEGYVAETGKPQPVGLIVLTPEGQAVPGRKLSVGVYQREWYSVKEQGSDGRFYWTSNYTDTLVESQDATTDAQGRASISFTPKQGGSYRIGAEARDDAGHTVKASAFTWAYGGDTFWGINDTARTDLIADKDRYKPGETANILVTAPYKGMRALMTIERGTVIEHKVLSLSGTTEVLHVPISADYAPNVYVSLVLIKPAGEDAPVPDVRVGLVNLPVSTEQQELNISVTPDKAQAGPGESVTYTVKTTDYSGKPIQAEVGLALVDKAVLSLADDPNPTLHQAFYEKRPLAVFTAQSLTALVDRVTLKVQPGAKGGGGGNAGEVLVRRNFPDTAYWNPALVTGADGTASVKVTLPDSLTTWRMNARALTPDTLVGQASNDLIATRPLLVRPSLPRFLTNGDALTIQAVVQNNTASPIDATVKLETAAAPTAQNISDTSAAPVQLKDPAEQRVSVPANGRALVRWSASVGAPAGQALADKAKLTFSLSGGGQQDSVEQVLPVQRFTTPEAVASAGQVQDTTVETIDVPANTDQGDLRLELVPSLAAGVESGLDYLRDYPYLCVEQTVSRFLPNAATARLFKQFGASSAPLEQGLQQNISAALQRLIATQQLDGGWGWWSTDKSDPYLTAYVIQGLLEARASGYNVDQQVFDRAVAYVKGALDSAETWRRSEQSRLNMRSYLLYVLGEAGRPDRGRAVSLYDQREQLSIYARAYLLMTLQKLGGEEQRAKTLVAELMSTAILNTVSAHWEEPEADYWNMSSDTRTTALALQALLRADPNNYLIPNAVRYLMGRRSGGHWETTQESSMTLLALAEYLDKSGELKANYRYSASLNGTTLREGQVTRDNLSAPVEAVTPLSSLKGSQPSRMTISRQPGPGRLYYTLRLQTYQDAAAVQPLDQGIGIQRQYIAVDTQTLSPTGRLVSQAKLGDLVQVRLTISAPNNLTHLAIEDMLPAGLEALDTSLKTASDAAEALDTSLNAPKPDPESEVLFYPYWSYFSQAEIHDNRVALFATWLPKGTYEYSYLARVTTPGTFQTLPALAYQLYQPEVFGRSAGATFTAQP